MKGWIIKCSALQMSSGFIKATQKLWHNLIILAENDTRASAPTSTIREIHFMYGKSRESRVCVCVCVLVTRLCPTLCNPMNWTNRSLPGFSIHGVLQTRIGERVAILFSRGSSWPRDWTWASCTAGRFLSVWATKVGTKPPWSSFRNSPGYPLC